jgi:S-methylmethionine-dependent homocysteine/selenocysteine methylase
MAAQWFDAGAQIVGGCCRTCPAHIRQVAEAADQAFTCGNGHAHQSPS